MNTSVGRLELLVLCIFAMNGGFSSANLHADRHEYWSFGTDAIFGAVFGVIAFVQLVKIAIYVFHWSREGGE